MSKGLVPPNLKFIILKEETTKILELDKKLYHIYGEQTYGRQLKTLGEILKFQKNFEWEDEETYLTDIQLKCSSCDHILNNEDYEGFPGYTENVYFNKKNKELVCDYCYRVYNFSKDYEHYFYNFENREDYLFYCDDCEEESDWLEILYHVKINKSEVQNNYNDYCEACFKKKNIDYDYISYNGIKSRDSPL